MVYQEHFYIHHVIQMGFQHVINGSTETYPQRFPSGQRPCHLQHFPSCLVIPNLQMTASTPATRPPPGSCPAPQHFRVQSPIDPRQHQLHNWKDGSTAEHQSRSARWKTFGTSTDGLFGTRADHSRSGGVNQGNINSLAAILGTDDLRQSLWSRLTQQFSWKSVWVG